MAIGCLIFLSIFGFALFVSSGENSFIAKETLLRLNFTKRCNLRMPERPALVPGQPVNITIKLRAITFREINELQQSFKIIANIQFRWKHPCVVWKDDEQWNDVAFFAIDADKTWIPILIQPNAAMNVNDIDRHLKLSKVRFHRRGIAVLVSYMDIISRLANFPFDVQKCKIEIGPWLNNRIIAMFLRSYRPFEVRPGFMSESERWILLDYYNYSSKTDINTRHEYDKSTFTFVFKRKSLSYLYNNLLPSLALAATLLASGIFPPCGERAIFCITVVLAYAVFQSSILASLPKTADIPRIMHFVNWRMIAGIFVTLETIIIRGLSVLKPLNRAIPSWPVIQCSSKIPLYRYLDCTVYLVVILITIGVDVWVFTIMLTNLNM